MKDEPQVIPGAIVTYGGMTWLDVAALSFLAGVIFTMYLILVVIS